MDDMIKVNVKKSNDINEIKQDRFISPDPLPQPDASRPKNKKPVLYALLVILVVAGIGYGGYIYYSSQTEKEKNAKAQIETLIADNAKLQKDIEDSRSTNKVTAATISSKLNNIKDAVSSKNTAALEQLMATKVTVLIAASGGVGERTPAQAVKDLDYVINGGTSPWDFGLTTETLTSYRSKSYAQYFPLGAVVGKSSNKYVVSFLFNDEGKITAIFMTNNETTLL